MVCLIGQLHPCSELKTNIDWLKEQSRLWVRQCTELVAAYILSSSCRIIQNFHFHTDTNGPDHGE